MTPWYAAASSRAAAQTQLLEDAGEVHLDRRLADGQALRELPVARARRRRGGRRPARGCSAALEAVAAARRDGARPVRRSSQATITRRRAQISPSSWTTRTAFTRSSAPALLGRMPRAPAASASGAQPSSSRGGHQDHRGCRRRASGPRRGRALPPCGCPGAARRGGPRDGRASAVAWSATVKAVSPSRIRRRPAAEQPVVAENGDAKHVRLSPCGGGTQTTGKTAGVYASRTARVKGVG